MADIEWPLTAVPEGQEYWVEWATSRTTSAFTGQQQVMGRPGAARWRTKLTITRHGLGARAFDALLTSMKGGLQPVLVPDFRRLGPGSTTYGNLQDWIDETYATPFPFMFDTGSYLDTAADPEDPVFLSSAWVADVPVPTIVGGAGGQVVVRGLVPGAVAFLPGDLLQTSPGRVHEVKEAASAAGDQGEATVAIQPRLRTAVASGVLSWPARARMRLDSSSAARNPTRAPVVSSYEIEMTEDLNV